MTVSINGTSGLVFNDASTQATAATGFGFKNRIINGAMTIDQRNAGASVTQAATVVYGVDRWFTFGQVTSKFTYQQVTDAPNGFKNSTKITSSSAYTVGSSELYQFSQNIEGFNVSDFGFGTASATPITLSFWVKSSLTGTFGVFLGNSAANRLYPASYTINAANTWEQKTISISGDTTGTWLTDNGVGLRVGFVMGAGSTLSGTANSWNTTAFSPTGATSVVGTNGATFFLTGVQLEKGSTATSFDYRPYGTELALCQRYYYRIKANNAASMFGAGFNFSSSLAIGCINFPVTMRIPPTSLEQSGTASDYGIYKVVDTATCTSVPQFNTADQWNATVGFTATGNLVAGQGTIVRALTTANGFLGFPAEL